jgi:hypothetical protein
VVGIYALVADVQLQLKLEYSGTRTGKHSTSLAYRTDSFWSKNEEKYTHMLQSVPGWGAGGRSSSSTCTRWVVHTVTGMVAFQNDFKSDTSATEHHERYEGFGCILVLHVLSAAN